MSTKSRKIIVISGKQFSGKDTVASVLMDILKDFKLAPIAEAIKIEFSEKKKLTVKEIEMNKPIYRADLIELGTKRREKDQDYWLKKVLDTEENIIISDVRLQHEMKILKKQDVTSIRIESDREERAKRGRLVHENDYTEVDLDEYKNWDYVIENNGSIEELKEKAAEIGEEIIKKLTAGQV